MATHDLTGNATGGSHLSGAVTYYNRLKHIPADGDVFQIFDVPKGAVVKAISMKVLTGSNGTTPTMAIGLTGGTTNGYMTAQAVTVAAEDTVYVGTGVYFGTTESTAVQGAFTSADTIDALFAVTGTPTATMELEFEMVCIQTSLA